MTRKTYTNIDGKIVVRNHAIDVAEFIAAMLSSGIYAVKKQFRVSYLTAIGIWEQVASEEQKLSRLERMGTTGQHAQAMTEEETRERIEAAQAEKRADTDAWRKVMRVPPVRKVGGR